MQTNLYAITRTSARISVEMVKTIGSISQTTAAICKQSSKTQATSYTTLQQNLQMHTDIGEASIKTPHEAPNAVAENLPRKCKTAEHILARRYHKTNYK